MTHAGQLVTKDDLWQAVWPGVTVTDAALTVCLSELGHVLEDDSKAPRFIETVHRRGYRFIAPLSAASPVSHAKFQAPSSDTQDSPLRTQPSVLVGRETELSHLHHWLEKALHGKRQLVFVTGEPGIGKTALVETFLTSLDTVDTFWLGRGRCIEHYGAGEPYLPVLQALGELGCGADRDHFLTVLRHYAPSWLVQLPALLEATERETLQRQTAGVTRERMLRELVEALEMFTAAQGVVLFLEDLHWSDPSTVEFLALLARRQAPARLLVVGTYRPVEVIVGDHPLKAAKQELQIHAQCQELPLPLLSEPAVAEYLAAIALSHEQGFPFFLTLGTILRGGALVEQGHAEEGITQIHQGLAAWQALRTELSRPSFLALLAEAYGKVGQVEEGLTVLAEALALVDKTGERYFEAELYRLKGQLMLQAKAQSLRSQVEEEAEACFHKSIAIARKQSAKSLELRAVMSLSRLWQQQGKREEAWQILADIYDWFTEGFDTKDLQEAKALLEELS